MVWFYLILMFGCLDGHADASIEYERFRLPRGQRMYVAKASSEYYQLELLVDQDRKLHHFSWFLGANQSFSAAINGGFFSKTGNPSGFFKYGKWWTKSSVKRSVLGILEEGDGRALFFDRLQEVDGVIQSDFYQNAWWDESEFILGGAPLLIHKGQILSFTDEKLLPSFVNNRYSRCAFCVDRKGDMMFILAEGVGRFLYGQGMRSGLSLHEFAKALKSLGCYHAINLDGGRSSLLFVDGYFIFANWFQWFFPKKIANVLAFVKKSP